jgi:hypothetical protein
MAILKTYFQTFKTDKLGQIFLTGILDVTKFQKVSVEIVPGPGAPAQNMSITSYLGKLSGATLGEAVEQFPLVAEAKIHTYDVVGPEFNLILSGGPANTDMPIQAWVFLH